MLKDDANYINVELKYANSESRTEVYSAFDVHRGKPVIVKRIASDSMQEAESVMGEGIHTISERHPHICECYDVHIETPRPSLFYTVIVTEELDHDLFEEIQARKSTLSYFPEERLRSLTQELVSTLAYLQRKNLAHRDIKPHNILVDRDGRAKLGDFGSSKELRYREREHTVLGTPLYLSPKLREAYVRVIEGGQTKVDHNVYKSDVYSLGLTLLHCMTLEPPTSVAVLDNLESRMSSVLSQVTLYSRPLVQAVAAMLTVDESQRPDFVQLEAVVNGARTDELQYVGGRCYLCERDTEVFCVCRCHPTCLECLKTLVIGQITAQVQKVQSECGVEIPQTLLILVMET